MLSVQLNQAQRLDISSLAYEAKEYNRLIIQALDHSTQSIEKSSSRFIDNRQKTFRLSFTKVTPLLFALSIVDYHTRHNAIKPCSVCL